MKAVYLEWDDSMSIGGDKAWNHRADIRPAELGCRSCGIVIREDARSITIAASAYGQSIQGDITIPKSAIRKRRIVSWKK